MTVADSLGSRRAGNRVWCGALCLLASAVVYLSPIDYTFSDPWGNLLTAQAILEHGTVRLDAYVETPAIADLDLAWQHRGHLYYFFPTGTSVFALPAVWLANLAGMDMAVSEHNSALQRLLSALTVALALLLVFVLCRLFVPNLASLLLAATFTFGSSTVSILGTALWSSNLTLLFNLAVVVLLVRDRRCRSALLRGNGGNGRNGRAEDGSPYLPYLIGLLLFCSYLCRPTAAGLVLVTFAYLTLLRRPLVIRAAVAFALPLAAFGLFSMWEYGTLLPPYYTWSRLGSSAFPTALLGNMVSPSRGLLVLCPYLVLVLLGAAIWFRRVRRDEFFVFGLAWLGLHWIAISLYPNWWGAWSFGNRLFADALPAAVLLTAIVVRAGLEPVRRQNVRREVVARTAKGMAVGFTVLATVAVYVHTWKGLYDRNPFDWCQDGTYVDHLFDWRHPQFLASATSLADHRRRHLLPTLPARSLTDPIAPSNRDVIFEGWSRPESGGAWRWSNGTSATLLLRVEHDIGGGGRAGFAPDPLTLEIVAGTFGQQRIPLRVNGVEVGVIASREHWTPARYSFRLDPALLSVDQLPESGNVPRVPVSAGTEVEIEFLIPGAQSPASLDPEGRGDRRALGLCLRQLTLSAG